MILLLLKSCMRFCLMRRVSCLLFRVFLNMCLLKLLLKKVVSFGGTYIFLFEGCRLSYYPFKKNIDTSCRKTYMPKSPCRALLLLSAVVWCDISGLLINYLLLSFSDLMILAATTSFFMEQVPELSCKSIKLIDGVLVSFLSDVHIFYSTATHCSGTSE